LRHSSGFRSSVVGKTLDGHGRSVSQIARETGVSYATIINWREKRCLGKLDLEDAGVYHRTSGIPEINTHFCWKAKPWLKSRKGNG
jgi:transposase